MELPELTATRIALPDSAGLIVISVMNQRPESRSYRTCGSLMSSPATRTGAQNAASVTFNGPSTPVLSNTLIRPFDPTMTCVGPTAPTLSGGTNPDSESDVPVKLTPPNPNAGVAGWFFWSGS